MVIIVNSYYLQTKFIIYLLLNYLAMTTLQQIKSNPKTNVWGSLGSRNRIPVSICVNAHCLNGVIWCVTSKEAIYRKNCGGFNESIDLEELPEEILIFILNQVENK